MIGSIVGAGMKAAGGIAGGIAARKAMKKYQKSLEKQQRENQAWFDRKYNEDATQRADAQRMLTMTEESIKNRNNEAQARNAVMGGTTASEAAQAEANAKAMATATSDIALNAEQRKDDIEKQYMQKNDDLQAKLDNLQMQKAQNTAQAIQGVAGAAGDIAGMF